MPRPLPALAGLSALLRPMHARAAHDGDAGFLARLYASTRMDLHSFTANPALVASIIGMQQRFQAAGYLRDFPDAQYLVLEHAEEHCGRIVVNAGPAALRLVDISLLPEARGNGLGRHVLRALQGCAAGCGLPLTLAVHHANPGARRLYAALGFEPTARDDVSEQMMWSDLPPRQRVAEADRPQQQSGSGELIQRSVVKSAKGVR